MPLHFPYRRGDTDRRKARPNWRIVSQPMGIDAGGMGRHSTLSRLTASEDLELGGSAPRAKAG
jgi:hypothetical protein